MLTNVAGWLVAIASALVAAGTVFVYLRRFGRWVVSVGRYIAELAQLPQAVRELAEELRDAYGRALDDHETRIGRLEAAAIPQETS